MVSRHSRSLFAALLAFALAPIVSMATGGSEAGAQATMAWQAKTQSLSQGLRAGVGEAAKHHADAIPFLPAETFRLVLSAPRATGIATAPAAAIAAAPATLHRARAPPALS